MTTNFWESFADGFEERNNYVVGLEAIQSIKSQLATLPDTGKVLELGCGNGTYTQCFFESAVKIIATDVSENMVAVTQERFSGIEMVEAEMADCLELPYNDSSFNTVFMANLLRVIPNPEVALSESFRVLKNNGKLVVVSFTLHGMGLLNMLLMKYRYLRTYGKKSSSTVRLTPLLANELVTAAGFASVSVKLLGSDTKAVYLTAKKLHSLVNKPWPGTIHG